MRLINAVNEIVVFTDDKSEAEGIGLALITDKKKHTSYYTSFAQLYIQAITYASHYGLYIKFDDVKVCQMFQSIAKVDYYQHVIDELGKKKKPVLYEFPGGTYFFLTKN